MIDHFGIGNTLSLFYILKAFVTIINSLKITNNMIDNKEV
jgi:hypothetical protein